MIESNARDLFNTTGAEACPYFLCLRPSVVLHCLSVAVVKNNDVGKSPKEQHEHS